jgi:phenylalanyl-tRNA synthetase beta chain
MIKSSAFQYTQPSLDRAPPGFAFREIAVNFLGTIHRIAGTFHFAMLISWNWLKQYVLLDMPLAELERRLMMAGLNHESTSDVAGDFQIDLEVTSNRPDCLGHIGIAREVAVLWQRDLMLPAAKPKEGATPVTDLTRVTLSDPELCTRYTARVLRGVKVADSPDWMKRRLATIGMAAINNVVDITNYVLMECGQPLHAFDLAKLADREIVVRDAVEGETLLAIDHKTYKLSPGMCVIADAKRAVGLGGVMGGAETEVSATTTDLLIEAAEFLPAAIRHTARALNLHSPSSYRFERGLDPDGIDWASRRCCELILELAGGELAAGVIDVGRQPDARRPIVLRLSQIERILGIPIDAQKVRQILTALGNKERSFSPERIEVAPPSWRRDLAREIDLIEEVGRIHGYEAVPEDVKVPMAASARSDEDRVLARIRHVMTAAGFDEALTVSVVEEPWSEAFSPWTDHPPLEAMTPILRRADRLRRSLVPSLLAARRANETLANARIELFETARVYLPRVAALPEEELMLALTSGGDYDAVKGVLDALVVDLNPQLVLEARATRQSLLSPRSAELWLGGELLGYLGEVSADGLKRFELRGKTTVAEIKIGLLHRLARLVPQYHALSTLPATSRDVNLVVDDAVRWSTVAEVVHASGGAALDELEYVQTYRNPQQLGEGKKSLLMTLSLRKPSGTLTSEEADQVRDRIVEACSQKLGAQLRV